MITGNPVIARLGTVLYWLGTIVAIIGTVLMILFYTDKGNLAAAFMGWSLLGVLPYALGFGLRYILCGSADHPFFSRILDLIYGPKTVEEQDDTPTHNN